MSTSSGFVSDTQQSRSQSSTTIPQLTRTKLTQIGNCFERGYAVFVNENFEIHLTTDANKLSNLTPSIFSRASNERLAKIFSQMVRDRQSNSIHHNSTDRGIEVAKRFMKSQVLTETNPAQIELRREITAARLGTTSDVLQANPGFQEFAQISHLHRYLLKFKESLIVDPVTKEISLRYQNQLVSWSTIAPKINYENAKWTGHYSKDGIQETTRFDWERLQAFDTGNPEEWGNQYVFEYVVWYADEPSLTDEPKPVDERPSPTGNHSFFRLKTPEKKDNIFSVGLYRPDKKASLSSLSHPMRVRKGQLMSPDESEFWGGRFTTFTKAITKEQFLAIKAKVEHDHASKNLAYHLTHANCNEYTSQVAQLAGLKLPSSFLPIASLILPIQEETAGKFHPSIRKAAALAATAAVNTFALVCAGATCVDPDAQCTNRPAHISSFKDIFDESKANFSHPSVLEKAFKKIHAWRAEQIALLEASLIGVEDLAAISAIHNSITNARFALPIEFVTN